MGAVLVTREIHDAFMQGPEHVIEFFHGYTYSGNPMAAAAGLGDARDLQGRGPADPRRRARPNTGKTRCIRCKGLPHVIDIRNLGLVGAIELEPIAGLADQARLLGLRQGLREAAC